MPNKKRNTTPDMGMMADNEVANLCSRFFEWYVVEDRPGDPTYDRRSSKVRDLGWAGCVKARCHKLAAAASTWACHMVYIGG